MNRHLFIVLPILIGTGCAPFWVVQRVEEKVDRLVQNTNRATLTQIFGEQSSVISRKISELGSDQQASLNNIMAEYERGTSTLENVRSSLLAVMGGGERVVSSKRGIWVRNSDGEKLKVIQRNHKLTDCRPLDPEDLPENITSRRNLMHYAWGVGSYNDLDVLFPWDLTMSGFTKEIVENTARRTAEEFIKMGGRKAWNRPINIQVITEPEGKGLKIRHPGDENEIYVSTDQNPTKENEE
jgi:hypothetical protein